MSYLWTWYGLHGHDIHKKLCDVYVRGRGCFRKINEEKYRFEKCCLIALMETVQTSETLVNTYQSTRRYDPEDSHLERCLSFLQA
jgi:hypothetical protein